MANYRLTVKLDSGRRFEFYRRRRVTIKTVPNPIKMDDVGSGTAVEAVSVNSAIAATEAETATPGPEPVASIVSEICPFGALKPEKVSKLSRTPPTAIWGRTSAPTVNVLLKASALLPERKRPPESS